MAKRIASTSVNWSFVMEILPPQTSQRFLPLKTASDKCLREIALVPAELPKIDWTSYKNKISAAGMVDSFMKAYEALKIPYPSDQGGLAEAEKLNAQLFKTAEDNIKKINENIKSLKDELKNLESVMKYSEMTLEELFLARPDLKIDPDNPKLAPYYIPDPPSIQKEH